jgi:sugar lactone lactonase YvrE
MRIRITFRRLARSGVFLTLSFAAVTAFAEPNPFLKLRQPRKPAGVLIADRQNLPSSLALDDRFLYWVTSLPGGWLARVPRAGGKRTLLAVDLPTPRALAIDERNVYWTNAGEQTGHLARMPKDGGKVTVLADELKSPDAIAIDRDYVYVVEWCSRIIQIEKNSGRKRTLVDGQINACELLVHNGFVYWATEDLNLKNCSIMRVAVSGGASTEVARVPGKVESFAASGSFVFIGGSDGVFRIDLRDGNMKIIADGESTAGGCLVVDGSFVYGVDLSSRIMRWALDGGQPASLLPENDANIRSLAVDRSTVFFTDANSGSVYRFPK